MERALRTVRFTNVFVLPGNTRASIVKSIFGRANLLLALATELVSKQGPPPFAASAMRVIKEPIVNH